MEVEIINFDTQSNQNNSVLEIGWTKSCLSQLVNQEKLNRKCVCVTSKPSYQRDQERLVVGTRQKNRQKGSICHRSFGLDFSLYIVF